MTCKKILLVRHGETMWSLTGQHTGLTDLPLTENGKKQAEDLSSLLKNNKISLEKAFVSPLKRAIETFKLSKLELDFEIEKDLSEWNYGNYEGMTSQEIHQIDPSWSIFTKGAPGGESLSDIQNRVLRLIEKINSCEGNVILFSSGHFLRAFATLWLNQPLSFGDSLHLDTASFSILGTLEKKPFLELWNARAPLFTL